MIVGKVNIISHENQGFGTSLTVPWLRLCTSNAEGIDSISGQGTRSHMPRSVAKNKNKNQRSGEWNIERSVRVQITSTAIGRSKWLIILSSKAFKSSPFHSGLRKNIDFLACLPSPATPEPHVLVLLQPFGHFIFLFLNLFYQSFQRSKTNYGNCESKIFMVGQQARTPGKS